MVCVPVEPVDDVLDVCDALDVLDGVGVAVLDDVDIFNISVVTDVVFEFEVVPLLGAAETVPSALVTSAVELSGSTEFSSPDCASAEPVEAVASPAEVTVSEPVLPLPAEQEQNVSIRILKASTRLNILKKRLFITIYLFLSRMGHKREIRLLLKPVLYLINSRIGEAA